jgi:hypothetical protein
MANLGQASKLVFEALVEVNHLETAVEECFLSDRLLVSLLRGM